jgi:hypothetical protein
MNKTQRAESERTIGSGQFPPEADQPSAEAKNYFVTLKVYDVLGREVKTLVNEQQSTGRHSITFNAAGLSDGVYFYRIIAGGFVETKKLLLMK